MAGEDVVRVLDCVGLVMDEHGLVRELVSLVVGVQCLWRVPIEQPCDPYVVVWYLQVRMRTLRDR